MKQFYCQCGQAVFFDSERCLNCGRRLGFDPASMTIGVVNNREDHHRIVELRANVSLTRSGIVVEQRDRGIHR